MPNTTTNTAAGSGAGTTQVYTGDNSLQISNGPLTTTLTGNNSTILRDEIDNRLVKIRPMSTPIDQISRHGDVRRVGSMKVNYYAVETKDISAKLSVDLATADFLESGTGSLEFMMKTDKNAIFSVSETLMVPGETAASDVMLYVLESDSARGVRVVAPLLKGKDRAAFMAMMKAGREIVRMGRTAAELDVQTAQFEALPRKKENLCQIFKMQVEESTLHRLANKEVGWNFSDQEEVAIIDMRQGMEKNFLFGRAMTFRDPMKNEDIYLTGGIWWQAGQEVEYDPETLDESTLISISRQAFTGGRGNSRKILVGGSGLIERLSNLGHERILSGTSTMTRWGLEFREIKTNFGTIYVIMSEVFDQCGHPDDGMLVDPGLITKYCHVPFSVETLNLRSSGQRNSDAVVITEASCLVLRHPDAHTRIVCKRA